VQALHDLTFNKIVDHSGRMAYNQKGEIIFTFGKHKDKPVEEVLNKESSYYEWMMNGDFTQDTKRRLTEIRLRMRNK
jgi:DNA polymerase-3 subunit epsilon